MSKKRTPNRHSQIAMLRIRRLRTSRGWTAEELARRMNDQGLPISRQTISNHESQRSRDLTIDELYAFAEVLGVSPSELADLATCDTCDGVPPPGFTCRSCGAATDTQETA